MTQGVRRGLRVDAVPEAQAARARARARDGARGRPDRRLGAPCARTSRTAGAEEPYSEGIIDHLRCGRRARSSSRSSASCRPAPPRRERARSGRTRTGVDVSAIARDFGGGGHKRAAGFSTDLSMDEITRASSTRSSPPTATAPPDRGADPEGARADGRDPRRQAGGAVVVRDRRARPRRARARRPVMRGRSTRSRPACSSFSRAARRASRTGS